jgi:hypothetical protein
MSRKNKTQNVNANEVSNLEAAAAVQPATELNAELETTTEEATEPATEEVATPEAAKRPNAVDEAARELEELKAKMAEAKKKLAEAKKATTKSRPVRMSTFVVRVCLNKTAAIIGEGEQMFKSDVHYRAEKAAIDVLAEDIKCGQKNEYVYAICKRSKANEDMETVVELLWTDTETNQIVIE